MPRWDGIDVAYPQPNNDFAAYLAGGGPQLVIAKCSEGNYTDPQWVRNMSGMRAHSIKYRGSYHFVTTLRHSVEEQAQAVLRAWDPFMPMRPGEALFLDFERDGTEFPDPNLVADLRDRLSPIFGRRRIGEYSGPSWVQGWNHDRLADMMLWASGGFGDEGQKAASYGATIWQYGGIEPPPPGIGGGSVDANMILNQANLDVLFGYEGAQMEQSLIQLPETLADGTPNPRAPEVWLAFGCFRVPVPDPDTLNALKYVGIPGPNRIPEKWFNMLVDASHLGIPPSVGVDAGAARDIAKAVVAGSSIQPGG